MEFGLPADPSAPSWQADSTRSLLFLKQHQPKTIIFWGQGDIFFTPAGGEAFLEVLPNAEIHRLTAGHFAVEDCLDYISSHKDKFYDTKVEPKA